MAADERYDIVVIGGGHNGTTIAAYLAKCGLSVCIVEERPECGGAQENTEPVAGARIAPHAIANYRGSAGVGATGVVEVRLPHGYACPKARVLGGGGGSNDGGYDRRGNG